MHAIIRTKRIKNYNKLSSVYQHNLRSRTEVNVDPTKTHLNQVLINLEYDCTSWKARYEALGVKARGNSVLAVEMVLTASPEFFEGLKGAQLDHWVAAQLEFLQKEHGSRLRHVVFHQDEKTPHLHALISVEETKTLKYKNRYGEGEKIATTLNAKRFNRTYLQDLQTRYAKAMKPFGLTRGMFNSRVKHKALKIYQNEVKKIIQSTEPDSIEKKLNELWEKNIEKNLFGIINANDAQKFFVEQMKAVYRTKAIAKKIYNENYKIAKKNNELLKKNQKLNQDLDNLRSDYYQPKVDSNKQQTQLDNLKKENEDLKKENELLQKKDQKDLAFSKKISV